MNHFTTEMQSSQMSSDVTLGRKEEPGSPKVSDPEKATAVVSDIPDGGLGAWLTVSVSRDVIVVV